MVRLESFCSTQGFIVFFQTLAAELMGSGVTVNAVHPGVIQTGLGDSSGCLGILLRLVKRFWKQPSDGAVAPAWLAVSPEAEGITGIYFLEKQEKHKPTPSVLEPSTQKRMGAVDRRLFTSGI
jgi:NAD(P)-dependent dehydrogenase (short-subunit alcohol dehydrogenase family)